MKWDKDQIKKLRTERGLSQSEFAHLLGCRQQTVSEWELGLYAPSNAYGKLLDLFKLTPSPAPLKVTSPLAAAAASWLSTPEEVLTEEPAVQESNREFDPAID